MSTLTGVETALPCNYCGSREHVQLYRKQGYELVKCRQCGLAFINNPPSDEELAQVYSFHANYHSSLATSSSARKRHAKRAQKNYGYLLRSVNPQPGRLLDVGCSAGFFPKVARDHGWDVEGVEFSKDTAALAREWYGLTVHNGTLETYEPQQGPFDCVTMWDVIEHVRNPSSLLRHAHTVLHDGGFLFMTTPNIDGLFPRLSYPLSSRWGIWRHPEPPQHLYQFSSETISSICGKCGFDVVTVIHDRIPFTYSFGNPLGIVKPWRLAEWLAFAPLALIGPWLRSGDSICVVAKKA